MSKEIAIANQQRGVQNFSMQDLSQMARAFAASGLFGCKTEAQALALMLVAQSEGRHPATVAQDYDIIGGRPAIRANSALARFQNAGGSIRWIERNDKAAEAEFSHPQGGTMSFRWDMDRAAKAGLTGKDNWKHYPAQMLSARVESEGVRAILPACLNGMYVVEEVRDIVDENGKKMKPLPPENEVVPSSHASPSEGPIADSEAINSLANAALTVFSSEEVDAMFGKAALTESRCKEIADEIRKRRIAIRSTPDGNAPDPIADVAESEEREDAGDR